MSTPSAPWLMTLALVLSTPAVAPAAGQATRPAASAVAPAEAPRHLLAGPKVREEPGAAPVRRPSGKVRAADRLPARRWLGVYRRLDLSAAQRRETERVLRRFEGQRRAYRRAHQQDMRAARDDLQKLRRVGARAVESGQRDRIRRLARARPPFAPVQHELWAQLDPDQQEAFRADLARTRALRLEERQRRRQRRHAAEQTRQVGALPTDRSGR